MGYRSTAFSTAVLLRTRRVYKPGAISTVEQDCFKGQVAAALSARVLSPRFRDNGEHLLGELKYLDMPLLYTLGPGSTSQTGPLCGGASRSNCSHGVSAHEYPSPAWCPRTCRSGVIYKD